MSTCRVFSCVVGRGCLLWPVHFLGKTLLVFAVLHSVFQHKFACYSRCFLTSYTCIPVPYNEKDIFWVLFLKGLVGLHRTIQLQLPQHYWLGHVLIYYICFSLSDLLHSVWQTLGSYTLHKWISFVPFYGWVMFHCVFICTVLCCA